MIKATHATTQRIRSVPTSPDVLVGQNIIAKVSPGASVTSGPLRAVKLPFFTQIQEQEREIDYFSNPGVKECNAMTGAVEILALHNAQRPTRS